MPARRTVLKLIMLSTAAVVVSGTCSCESEKTPGESAADRAAREAAYKEQLSQESLNERLFSAAVYDDIDRVRKALTDGAEVNARDSRGDTPLMLAATFSSSAEMITVLLEAGATVNDRDSIAGVTALMRAAGRPDNVAAIELLLSSGAEAAARDENGRGVLNHATMHYSHAATIELLLEAGAEPDWKDFRGITPLMQVARSYTPEAVRMLVDAGAAVNAIDNEGRSPVHWACVFRNETAIDILTVLHEAGADFDVRDREGATALMRAAEALQPVEVIQFLLDRGIDPLATDNEGRLALDYAIESFEHQEQMPMAKDRVIRRLRETVELLREATEKAQNR